MVTKTTNTHGKTSILSNSERLSSLLSHVKGVIWAVALLSLLLGAVVPVAAQNGPNSGFGGIGAPGADVECIQDHHGWSNALGKLLNAIESNSDAGIRAWAIDGVAVIFYVAGSVTGCSNGMFAIFRPGYERGGAVLNWRGGSYGMTTHFLVRSMKYVWNVLARYGGRATEISVSSLSVSSSNLLSIIPAPGTGRCSQRMFELYGWRWCSSVNQ